MTALSVCSFLIYQSCTQQWPAAAAAASVCRQPTCCFQEPLWITELRQSSRRTSEGKPEDIFSVKYDLVSLKLLFCATNSHALSFIFRSSGLRSKLHSVALKYKIEGERAESTSGRQRDKAGKLEWQKYGASFLTISQQLKTYDSILCCKWKYSHTTVLLRAGLFWSDNVTFQ